MLVRYKHNACCRVERHHIDTKSHGVCPPPSGFRGCLTTQFLSIALGRIQGRRSLSARSNVLRDIGLINGRQFGFLDAILNNLWLLQIVRLCKKRAPRFFIRCRTAGR